MTYIRKNFAASRMNKGVDERFLPEGELIDAVNIRIASDQDGEGGTAENDRSNELLTNIKYFEGGSPAVPLSASATCIGAKAFPDRDLIFWCINDPGLGVDMIVSYNTKIETVIYHVITKDLLNFSATSRVRCIDLIDDILIINDDRNPPRAINIKRNYPGVLLGVDQITEDDISLIVKPPIQAPTVTSITSATGENYMEDKFIRFATRYRYKDGQYSAVSHFSDPAFIPGNFKIDYETFDQIGMLNAAPRAIVQFDTGDKNVTEVDVLFKESDSNIIKVIEKFVKADQGWGNNETKTLPFDNRKIYTTLLESETLRLYDNVPLKVAAQSVIGNRIMFGNYLEGYDIDTIMDYGVELISNDIGGVDLGEERADYTYSTYESKLVANAGIEFDLTGQDLVNGSIIFIDLNFEHDSFGGSGIYPSGAAQDFTARIAISLNEDYASVADFYNSVTFQKTIGGTYALPIGSCSDGYTLDDTFNCSISPALGWTYEGTSQFIIERSGNIITIFPPVIRFEQISAPGTYAYEYFYNVASRAFFRKIAKTTSLHSDRDFETGIVYMDGHSRSCTVQVDKDNTVYVPKINSDKQNYIRATINHDAPSWAKYYKFVVKPSTARYDIIYANRFYKDSRSGTWYIRLVGDNISKVEVGDRLIVKRDIIAVNYGQDKVKVLSKEAKIENFIDPTNPNTIQEPTGVYMEVPGNFNIDINENSFISYGKLTTATDASNKNPGTVLLEGFPFIVPEDTSVDWYRQQVFRTFGCVMFYPTMINTGTEAARVYEEYDIPEGSYVNFKIECYREGGDKFRWFFEKEFIATTDYDNMYDFILGEDIDFTIPSNDPDIESNTTTPTCEWSDSISPDVYAEAPVPLENTSTGLFIQYARLPGGGTDGQDLAGLTFVVGPDRYGGHNSRLNVSIEVSRSTALLVFETEPEDTDGITFYEGSDVFEITNRKHAGNVQDQTVNQAAIIDLNFADCYTFGNGVESYKTNDALDGRPLDIGPRTHIVSDQDYKEIRRATDITYSGVYNLETKLNKLNVFNLALSNFKPLDSHYGPIELMHSRRDNILVLKQDSISYVLANGKELFSDAAGGGAILSVPSVLGQEITRPERFGISSDPDSFAAWGSDVWFSDERRDSIIRLSGGGYQESLDVISRFGMRTWFRNLFRDSGDVFRVGAFDPFNNEYVFSNTSQSKISSVQSAKAGSLIQQLLTSVGSTYEIDLGDTIGQSSIDYEVEVGSLNITVTYNGSEVINTTVTGSGTLTFSKSESDVSTATVTLTPTAATFSVSVGEPSSEELTIIKVATNSFIDEDKITSINWDLLRTGAPSFTAGFSKGEEEIVVMSGTEVGLYSSTTGAPGTNNIPNEGDTIRVRSSLKKGDSYLFEEGVDRLMYLVSDTLYSRADVITTLRPLMTDLTPIIKVDDGEYKVQFTYTNPTNKKYLYLMWDFYPVKPPSETFDSTTVTFDTDLLTFDQE